jgi:hypothetical protein
MKPLAAWLTLSVTVVVLIDAMFHHAYVAAGFLVLTLRLAMQRVLQAHKLWGRG